MMYTMQVFLSIVFIAGQALAVGYGGGYGGGAGGGGYGGYGQNFAPQPFAFDYQARDEFGNNHFRQEHGDQSGNVRGTYGYTDNQGLYRTVEYVADAGGFRANVKTNEPGVGEDSPADVQVVASHPPAGIQDRYTRLGYGGAGAGGARFGAGGIGGGPKPYKGGY